MRLFQNKKASHPSASESVCDQLFKRFNLKIPFKLQSVYCQLFNMQKIDASDLAYKRLIYLGNAVIRTISTEWLFEEFPYADEGDLTEFRILLCNQDQIKVFGQKLRFDSIAPKPHSIKSNKHSFEGKRLKILMSRLFMHFGYNHSQVFYIQYVLNAFVNRSKLEKIRYRLLHETHAKNQAPSIN